MGGKTWRSKMIPPKGYRRAGHGDKGKECIFTNINHSALNDEPLDEDFIKDTLYEISEDQCGAVTYTSSSGWDHNYCYIKKGFATKTIELDPLLDSRLDNIDYMILQREIELNILRKLKESK